MTYLVPDDWYANHGLAPGDARRPQQTLQPRPGNLAPTPPLRGYFGRPPMSPPRPRHATLSPFAVSDVMWGVHGLGALGDQAYIQEILANLKEDMKKQAIEQAAVSTGITIALAAIPVVGWAASAIYSVVQVVVSTKYKKEAQEIVAETQREAKKIVASYELKLATAQNSAFEQEQNAAMALALSCSPLSAQAAAAASPVNGLGFSFKDAINPVKHFRDITRPIRKVVKQVAPPEVRKVLDKADGDLKKLEQKAEQGLDTLSGKAGVTAAKEARDRILADVRKTMQMQYDTAVSEMAKPEFRINLRLQIASKLRADPAVAVIVQKRCDLAKLTGGSTPAPATAPGLPGVQVRGSVPASKANLAPLAAAGVVALLFLGKGG